jgi:gentisate 1,2-dioxygenase
MKMSKTPAATPQESGVVYANVDAVSDELAVLHDDITGKSYIPGWNRKDNPPMWDRPAGAFVPGHWTFSDARAMLDSAGELVSPELAERRNLILLNPAEGNRYPTVRTQVIAYQMIRPDEHARTHRHAPHAGRLVLEADEGAYTVVDGVKIPMLPGDVVLTPGWHWHGHGHDGKANAYWIDFLDIPLVQLLEPMFFEPHPDGWLAATSETRTSPLLFPYDKVSAALDETEPDLNGQLGRCVNLGVESMIPTIGLRVQRFDPDTKTWPYQVTANIQYLVVEGSGTTFVEGERFDWSRGDVIAVPSWSRHHHVSEAGATVLAVTDEPVQTYCGYFRTAEDIARGDGKHRSIQRPVVEATGTAGVELISGEDAD